MELRRHIWLPGDVSLCHLATNTGEIAASGLDPDDVASCGPCLVAASTLSLMATKMLDVQPVPVDDVVAATTELLAGPFHQVGHADLIGAAMLHQRNEFDDWVTVVVGPGVDNPTGNDPDPIIPSPAAADGSSWPSVDLTGDGPAEISVA